MIYNQEKEKYIKNSEIQKESQNIEIDCLDIVEFQKNKCNKAQIKDAYIFYFSFRYSELIRVNQSSFVPETIGMVVILLS